MFPNNSPYFVDFDRNSVAISPPGELVPFIKEQIIRHGGFEEWMKDMKANKDIDQLITLLNVYKDTATKLGIHGKDKSKYTASIQFEQNSYYAYFIHADGIGMTIMSLRKILGKLCSFANVKLDFPVDNELFWLDGFTQDWEFYSVEGESNS